MEETLRNILNLVPVWEDDIWEALQDRRFVETARKFQTLLAALDDDEWNAIAWEALLSGIPAVRGELTEAEWGSEVRPRLAQAALAALAARRAAPPIELTIPSPSTAAIPLGPIDGAATPEEGRPLVIHRETETAPIPQARPDFSLPFSLFRSKTELHEQPKTAQIETPEEKKPEKRVVHYSESRTEISPFGSSSDFLKAKTPSVTAPATPTREAHASAVPITREEPRPEGGDANNLIDLRNLS